MKADNTHGTDIGQGYEEVPEAEHYHHIYIMTAQCIQMSACRDRGVCDLKCEVEQVVDNECRDQKACPDHIPGGKGGAEAFVHCIALRFCGIVLQSQLY